MFSWFKKNDNRSPKPASSTPPPPPSFSPPLPSQGNPGIATSGQVHFSNASGTWTEAFDTIQILSHILQNLGHEVRQDDKTLISALETLP